MNTVFWHRHLIRAFQASLLVLCAGFFTFSIAGDHSHDNELTALASVPESAAVIAHPDHQQVDSTVSHDHAPVINDDAHRGHGAHASSQSPEPCPMPCDNARPCPSVCALACAPGSVPAVAISANVGMPQCWGFARVPTHDDADAIIELTLSPLYRPPIS